MCFATAVFKVVDFYDFLAKFTCCHLFVLSHDARLQRRRRRPLSEPDPTPGLGSESSRSTSVVASLSDGDRELDPKPDVTDDTDVPTQHWALS
jgi:hypothetical protein